MKHRISVMMIALLLASLLLPCAFAEEGGLAVVSAKQNTDNRGLQIDIANALANADKLENYKVTLGGNLLTLRSVTASSDNSTAEKKEEDNAAPMAAEDGTSWIFLVDISTVSSNAQRGIPLIDTLGSLFNLISKKDNAALVNTAMFAPVELIGESDSPKAKLNEQLKATTKYNASANKLYDAVIESLEFLMTNSEAKDNKCLVVLSKGDNKNGDASLNDVLDKIDKSNVAVYTIAYIDGVASADFGSMAQESIKAGHGGGEINKDTIDNGEYKDVAPSVIQRAERERNRKPEEEDAEIPENTAPKFVLQTDQPKDKGVDNTVVVSFTEGGTTTSAAFVIANDIVYPQKGFFDWLGSGLKKGDIACVAIVACAAVLLVLAAVLIIRNIRERKSEQADYNAGEDVPSPANESIISQTTTQTSIVDVPQRKRLQLSLREASGKSHRAMLTPEGISVGRQGDNHVILDSEDKHISRHHFILKQSGEEVMLESISETNGTYVNGMRVEGPIALRQKDTIRVGGTEMTVTWKYV